MIKNKKSTNQTASPIGQIVTVTSGKGGVGKTSVTVNLGLALAQQKLRVCVVDADTNLANINIMLKQVPEYTLEHVINGEKNISDIMLQTNDLFVVPAATGVSSLVSQSKKQNQLVVDAVTSLRNDFDYVLIDTSAGISDSVLRYIRGSHQSLFVITSEPTSLTDSYSLLKVLFKNKIHRKTDIVMNFAQNDKHAKSVFSRFSSAVKKYLDYDLGYLGFVFRDDYLSSSVCFQNPILIQRPSSKTSQCFRNIAQNLHAGLKDRCDDKKYSVDLDSTNASAEFSSGDVIEKTVSLVNLENDFDKYLKSNPESKSEIESTLKNMADKYQRVFRSDVVVLPVEGGKKPDPIIKPIKPTTVKASKTRKNSFIDATGEHLEYQIYLDSIHFASLIDDCARGSQFIKCD